MGVFDEVVFAFGTGWVARQTTWLTQTVKVLAAPSHHFVNVGLVTGVPDDLILG